MVLVVPLSQDCVHSLSQLRDRTLPSSEFGDCVENLGYALVDHLICEDIIDHQKVYAVVVMRAGLGLWFGARELLPGSAGFIDVKRDHESLKPTLGMYKCAPDLDGKTVLVFETMLATGGSLSAAITALKRRSSVKNARIIAVTLLAAPEGIARIHQDHPEVLVVTACIDKGLDANGYIVPGLGDAGDRLYGRIE